MADTGEPVPGAAPAEAVKPKDIPLRDKILAQIEDIVTDSDDGTRKKRMQEFVSERNAELIEGSEPTTLSLAMGSMHHGFIHPESRVRRNFLVDPFRVDDPEVFTLLLDSIREFKTNPEWKDKSMREIVPHALIRTIGEYFGNYYGTHATEGNNREFYLDRSDAYSDDISISEFRGKKIGVCAEKAAVAQNLLVFMGYETELVMSTNNRLNSPDADDQDGHA